MKQALKRELMGEILAGLFLIVLGLAVTVALLKCVDRTAEIQQTMMAGRGR